MNDFYSGLTVFDGNTFAIVSYGHIQHSSGKGEFYRWERRQLLLHLDTQVLGLGDEKAEVVPPISPLTGGAIASGRGPLCALLPSPEC